LIPENGATAKRAYKPDYSRPTSKDSSLPTKAGVILVLFLIIKNGSNHGPFVERTLPYQLSVNWISDFQSAILNRTLGDCVTVVVISPAH
jgi:hypothetical protein